MEDHQPHGLQPTLPLSAAPASAAATGEEMVPYRCWGTDVPGSSGTGGKMPYWGTDVPGSSGTGGGDVVLAASIERFNHQGNNVVSAAAVEQFNQGHLNVVGPAGLHLNQDLPPFDRNRVEVFMENRQWIELQNYVERYLPGGYGDHPMILLHILRAWALDLIEFGMFDGAASLFNHSIKDHFQAVLSLGQSVVRNAKLEDLIKEINFIGSCVHDRKCHAHPFSSEKNISFLLQDYLLLYLPNTRFTDVHEPRIKTGLWQFAVLLERRNHRSKFRCLVCSKVFSSGTIGDMAKHLSEDCIGFKRTPYLMQKYEAARVHVPPESEANPQERRASKKEQESSSRKRKQTEDTDNDPPEATKNVGVLQRIGTEAMKAKWLAENVGNIQIQMKEVADKMSIEAMKAKLLSENVGKIHIQTNQVVDTLFGLLTESQAAFTAGSASRSGASKAGQATHRNTPSLFIHPEARAESQRATVATPSVYIPQSGLTRLPTDNPSSSNPSLAIANVLTYQAADALPPVATVSASNYPANANAPSIEDFAEWLRSQGWTK